MRTPDGNEAQTHDEVEARLFAAGSEDADPPRRRSALALVLPGAAIWAVIAVVVYLVLR